MNTFSRANDSLRTDLEAYARVLRVIIASLPKAQELCEQVLKETRLIQALLAFGNSSQVVNELNHLAFHLTNLWPYRERPFDRTMGFSDEIEEAVKMTADANHGLQLVNRLGADPMAHELKTCFSNIVTHLTEEKKLLEECHGQVRPHANNMEMTRKRLNLLIAAIDARVAPNPEQQASLRAYRDAAALLGDWESGVPLNDRGVEIIEKCLDALDKVDGVVFGNFAR